jgi:acetyl esterase/lipase
MDLYSPPNAQSGARIPAVIFVAGYSDVGIQKMLGCKLKEMGSYISWAQLVAASGLVAITYSATEPVADLDALLQHLRQNTAELGIDENKLGVWACSGNVPNALSVLMQESNDFLKCAVLLYGLMLDLDGSTNVAQAAKMFGFANSSAGKSVDDLPAQLPLFIARAGQDNPQLNETIDRFLSKAVSRNLPVTFVNHSAGPHFFDVMHNSEASRAIIRQILAFMRFHLLA